MAFRLIHWVPCCITSILCACGPIYETKYTYLPPTTPSGSMCLSQCMQSNNLCEQLCQMNKQNCINQARQEASWRYQAYEYKRRAKGKPINKTPNDFVYDHACDQACNCLPTFNACYTGCGGQIIAHDVCVAFCNQA